MQKKIEDWLRLHRYEEGWERNQALMLYIALLVACFSTALMVLMDFLYGEFTVIYAVGTVLVLSVVLLGLVWRGYIRQVGWLFPLGIFLVVAMQTFRNSGMFDDAMFAYPGVIILAGLLNRRRGVLVFTLLVLIAVSVVGGYQINRPELFLFTDYANPMRLLSILMLLTATGVMVFLIINNLLFSLQKLQESERALAQTNQELRDVQASMEAAINERTRNIEVARREAEMARRAIEAQAWIATGLSKLNDVMRGGQDIQTLANNILNQLSRYLNAHTAVLFILNQGKLKRVGGYAYSPNANLPDEFEIGDGLVGQAALTKEIILLENIPENSIRITSGLGNTNPKNLVLLPLLYNDELVGVIEMGFLSAFRSEHQNFLTIAEASIAISIHTALAYIRMNELLIETQSQAEELQAQAEEMQAQEEELRAVNEELLAQAESLRISRGSSSKPDLGESG